jgi:hypothetical protein
MTRPRFLVQTSILSPRDSFILFVTEGLNDDSDSLLMVGYGSENYGMISANRDLENNLLLIVTQQSQHRVKSLQAE